MITIHQNIRPILTPDMTTDEDIKLFENELESWNEWPYEIEIETDESWTVLYGQHAYDYLIQFLQQSKL